MTEVGGGGGPPRFPGAPKEPLPARPKAAAEKAKGAKAAQGKGKAAGPAQGAESKGDAGLSQDSFSRSVGGAAGIRQAVAPAAHAFVRLKPNNAQIHGELRALGRLTVEWDPARAPAQVLAGAPGSWGAELGLRFTPRGQPQFHPCAELVLLRGVPMGMPKGAAVTVDVPVDAQGVELWVRIWRKVAAAQEDLWDIPRDKPLVWPVKPRLQPT